MNDASLSTEIMLRAVRDSVEDRLKRFRPVARQVSGLTVNGKDVPGTESYVEVPLPEVNVTNQVPVPSVTVNNAPADVTVNVPQQPTPVVNVTVSMEPIARALAILVAPLTECLQRLEASQTLLRDHVAQTGEMLSQLLQVLADQQPPTFSPNVSLRPRVTVAQPDGKPKTFVITHDDGTKSTATVE